LTALVAGSSLILASVLATAGISNASTDSTTGTDTDTVVASSVAADAVATASEHAVTQAGVDGEALSASLRELHEKSAAERAALRDALAEHDGAQLRDGMHAIATERRSAIADIRAEFGLGTGNGDTDPSEQTGPAAQAHAKAHAHARGELAVPKNDNGKGENGTTE